MATKIYTRTGDGGETGLWGGARVPKDDPRVEAYGAVDEFNASLGLARALASRSGPLLAPAAAWLVADDVLAGLQAWLFSVGSYLATPPGDRASPVELPAAAVATLEQAIDAADERLAPLASFVLPTGTPVAAALHVARTVCRRAERRCITLAHTSGVTLTPAGGDDGLRSVVRLLNRAGDLLFVLARLANHLEGVDDTPWTPPRPAGRR